MKNYIKIFSDDDFLRDTFINVLNYLILFNKEFRNQVIEINEKTSDYIYIHLNNYHLLEKHYDGGIYISPTNTIIINLDMNNYHKHQFFALYMYLFLHEFCHLQQTHETNRLIDMNYPDYVTNEFLEYEADEYAIYHIVKILKRLERFNKLNDIEFVVTTMLFADNKKYRRKFEQVIRGKIHNPRIYDDYIDLMYGIQISYSKNSNKMYIINSKGVKKYTFMGNNLYYAMSNAILSLHDRCKITTNSYGRINGEFEKRANKLIDWMVENEYKYL